MTDIHVRPRLSWWATLLCLVAVIGGAIGAVAVMGSQADAAAPATQRTVLRPVTTTGHAAKGYRIVTDHRAAIECYDAAAAAVDGGIAYCGSSADNTLSCWASATKGRVLCLTDPFVHTLRSIRLSGAFPAVRAPRHTKPQALALANGGKYLARSGGAWSVQKQHPTWVGQYTERATYTHTIYGPGSGDGVNRHHARWFVTTFKGENGPGTRHDVTTAYYVGTAGR